MLRAVSILDLREDPSCSSPALAWKHLNLGRVQLNVFESNRRAIRAYEDVMVMAALNPSNP